MYKTMALFLVAIVASGAAIAQQKTAFVGDFESGQIQKADQTQDGFYVRTLPDPQVGTESVSSGTGGFGPSANLDTRVVKSEVVGSETVMPRVGDYFARSALYYSKSYVELNNNPDLDKPRSYLGMGDPVHRFDYDTEGYLGFSVYVPLNYEHETGTRNVPGAVALMVVQEPQTAQRIFFVLQQFVPTGASKARWYLRYHTSTTSTEGGVEETVDLGPVEVDRGMWTDFVIRFRENPFSVDTNPAKAGIPHAMDKLYEGNKGILQVWKAEGPKDSSGNRKMTLKVNKVNTPVGRVPHETDKRVVSFRVYKYGWKKNPTTVKGPIWFGFDEIRMGFVKDGASYADVDPSARSCVDGCGSVAAAPKPPAQLRVE